MVNYFLLVTLSSLSFFFFLPSPSSSPLLCIYIYLPSRERVCFPNQKEPLLSNRSRNFYAGIIEASHLCFVFPFSLITLPLPPSLRPSIWLAFFFFSSATHRGGRRINQKSFEGETEGRERERRGGKWRGREEGVAKSIPQVNLRLEIFYTINKQGESGDGKGGEGEGGVGSGSRTQS